MFTIQLKDGNKFTALLWSEVTEAAKKGNIEKVVCHSNKIVKMVAPHVPEGVKLEYSPMNIQKAMKTKGMLAVNLM